MPLAAPYIRNQKAANLVLVAKMEAVQKHSKTVNLELKKFMAPAIFNNNNNHRRISSCQTNISLQHTMARRACLEVYLKVRVSMNTILTHLEEMAPDILI